MWIEQQKEGRKLTTTFGMIDTYGAGTLATPPEREIHSVDRLLSAHNSPCDTVDGSASRPFSLCQGDRIHNRVWLPCSKHKGSSQPTASCEREFDNPFEATG